MSARVAWDGLRRPLELAAADRFGGLERIARLGIALEVACDRVLAADPEQPALRVWRADLTGFDTQPIDRRQLLVARGLRLLASARLAAEASPPMRRRSASAMTTTAPIASPVPPAPAAAPAVPPAAAPAAKPRRAAAPRAVRASAKPAPAHPVDPLRAGVASLRGIGPKTAEALAARGIETVEDLLWLLPRRYDDVRALAPMATVACDSGDVVVVSATVRRRRMVFGRGRRWLEAVLADGDVTALVRWFGVHGSMADRLPEGATVALTGKVRVNGTRWEFANPEVLGVLMPGQATPADGPPGLIVRYPDVPGVPPGRLRTAVATAARAHAMAIDDGIPAEVIAEVGLGSLGEALTALHLPAPELTLEDVRALVDAVTPWHRRVVFAELFGLAIAVAQRRRQRIAEAAHGYPRQALTELTKVLPFALTAAQARVIDELGADLAGPTPMGRLLQGDVGCGKTAVLFAAALQVWRGGGQVAVMAPTELLAEQHLRTFRAWGEPLGLRVELFSASQPAGVRQSQRAMLAAGRLDIAVGTHALIADAVGFAQLGLVVIDEQHRFGVAQRVRLRSKGAAAAPHLLVVTATPIPRTLALASYGDLDTSIIDELPPGRTPVATRVLRGRQGKRDAYGELATAVRAGAQAYVVCPLVEPSEDEDGPTWADAVSTAEMLAEALAPARVGLVHGRMARDERDQVMTAFRAGELAVLVATTVIEVGVDVPRASWMLIEDADHFGLAQLHQLRGRVGRGGGASHCLLLARAQTTIEGDERLAAMAATTSGFAIAERDLDMRGPGELLGARQAGIPRLRFGDLQSHAELLRLARDAAHALLARDPDLASPRHARLRLLLERRAGVGLFGAEGG